MTAQEAMQNVIRGFDNGVEFLSEQQVREYFSRENYTWMGFETDSITDEDFAAAAQHVIDNRLHCAF